MKKILLSLAVVAVAFGANADKALIICDGAQVFYKGEMPAATVVVPVGFDAKNDGGAIVCDAGQLKWVNPSSFACRNGAIRWTKEIEATFTPTAGITITKITTRSALDNQNVVFGDGWTKNEDLTSTYVPTDGTKAISMKPAAQNRMNWMEIEYTGTPTQVLPAVATSFDLAQEGSLAFESATEGATIHYTLDGTDPTTDSPVAANGKIDVAGDVLVKTIAVKENMTPSFIYQQPVMAAKAGSSIAKFFTSQPSTMSVLQDNVPTQVSNSMFKQDNGSDFVADKNSQINLGPCLSGATKDAPIIDFVSDGVKMYFYGGNSANPRYYYSYTFGGNYEIRGYVNTTMNFEAPEGKVITDVMFNGADIQSQIVAGYSQLEKVDDADKYVTYTTDIPGTLTQSPIYSKWSYHFTSPEGGLKKVQILSNGSTTKYLSNFFVCVADAKQEGSGVAGIEAEENAPVEYYNLQGIRVANPENGLYIVKQGNKVTKRVIK